MLHSGFQIIKNSPDSFNVLNDFIKFYPKQISDSTDDQRFLCVLALQVQAKLLQTLLPLDAMPTGWDVGVVLDHLTHRSWRLEWKHPFDFAVEVSHVWKVPLNQPFRLLNCYMDHFALFQSTSLLLRSTIHGEIPPYSWLKIQISSFLLLRSNFHPQNYGWKQDTHSSTANFAPGTSACSGKVGSSCRRSKPWRHCGKKGADQNLWRSYNSGGVFPYSNYDL